MNATFTHYYFLRMAHPLPLPASTEGEIPAERHNPGFPRIARTPRLPRMLSRAALSRSSRRLHAEATVAIAVAGQHLHHQPPGAD